MTHGQGTADHKDGGQRTMEAVADLAASLVSVLGGFAADTPPQRCYSATVEEAARAVGGPVSLWSFEKGSPVLLAVAGHGGEHPGEGLLATMKDAACGLQSSTLSDAASPTGDEKGTASAGLMCVLIESFGEGWGVLVASPGQEKAASSEFMKLLAKAVGLVAEKAALHDEVAHLRGKVAVAERSRDPMARYARLGQVAVRAYDEMSQIIGAVEKTISRSLRVPIKSELEEAIAELKRAGAILNEQIELAQLEVPVLEMSNLTQIVQQSVREIESEIGRKSLRLLKRLDPKPPLLLLDSDKVRMALDKVLAAAVTRTGPEGWLRVESDADEEEARVQITWEEKGAPGVAAHDMFVPFGAIDKGGVGLAVASQIIREHGGGVRAKRLPSGTVTLVIGFPIGKNQDRRRRGSRRSGLDRRRPGPEDE